MKHDLQKRTLELVRSRVKTRGDIRPLADELSVSYFVIYRIVRGETQTLDAALCQRLYERLSGHVLEIR